MKMFINGKATGASDGEVIAVFNPATNEIIDTVPAATESDVHDAIRQFREAFCVQ